MAGGTTRVNDRTDAVIAGIGQTDFSKESGRSELHLAAQAARAAIADAGLEPSDIDGTVTFTLDTNDELALARTLGIPALRFTARTRGGGGGSCTTVRLASTAIRAGAARAVLVYRAFNERSGRRFGQPRPASERSVAGMSWYLPFGLDTPAKFYGLWFQRYMHRYGVTNEDFGRYSVIARRHASTNPAAWYYGRPITLEEHQQSRWIVEPVIRLLDCCQESDGGVALVVVSGDRAGDLPRAPARIAASAEAHLVPGDEMFGYYHPDISGFPEAAALGRALTESSGLGVGDIDIAMLYENFSPIVLLQLEALGFCGPGEAKDFIAEGHIALDGSLPVNPNGGLLGEGYIHGMNNIVEAVRQIRGDAANQVSGARHVLVSSGRSGLILSGP
jgi:17-hydroxy-3-oxo-4-pregnene-20-carboxyl-CoA lyase